MLFVHKLYENESAVNVQVYFVIINNCKWWIAKLIKLKTYKTFYIWWKCWFCLSKTMAQYESVRVVLLINFEMHNLFRLFAFFYVDFIYSVSCWDYYHEQRFYWLLKVIRVYTMLQGI